MAEEYRSFYVRLFSEDCRRFSKIFQKPDERFRTFPTRHFPKIAEDDRTRSEDASIIQQQI